MTFDKNTNKDEQAYLLIKDKILNLELLPQQPVREIELSEMLSMSRTPIRAAIAKLISDGFVKEVSPKQNIVTEISVESFKDIYQMREALENLCVSLAAFAWTNPDDLQAVFDTLHVLEKVANEASVESRTFLKADRTFHYELAKIAGNSLLTDQMMRIYDLYWRYNFYSLHANRAILVTKEHQEIAEAIKNRDRYQAKKAMKDHLLENKEHILVGLAKGFDPIHELKTLGKGYFMNINSIEK